MANRTVAVNLIARTAQFTTAMRAAGNDVATVQRKIADGDAALKRNQERVSRGMLLVGGAAVAGAGMAVRAFAQFDKSMSNVRAVSGATAEEMGQLRDAALDAGKATVFSASEAADATAELAKAGIGTADILGGALRGSLDLAAAGNLDLAEAATIAAQAMNIFKLEGRDVGHIADVLAGGANKSAADVKTLGDALRQGGLVAAQTGADLEETVGTLSAFADNALVGSDAGTALKTMMQRLTPDTDKAADAMRQIGLQAFDAQGEFVGLETVAGQLQQGLGRMSTEQRAATLELIFGADAVRAANVLYEQGAHGIRDYTQAVDDNGAAQRMAADQLDNLVGDLEAFKGSVETALIQSGSGANGALRGMTQAATGAVNAFADLPGAVQGAVTVIAGLGGAALGTVGGLGYLVPKVKEGRAALQNLGVAGQFADRQLGRLGRTAGIVGAVTAVTVAVKGLVDVVDDMQGMGAPSVDKLTNSLLKFSRGADLTGEAAQVVGEDFEAFRQGIEGLDAAASDLAAGKGINAGNFERFGERLDGIDQALAGLVSSGNAEAAGQILDALAEGANLTDAQVEKLRRNLPAYSDALAGVDTEATLAADSTEEFGGTVEDAGDAADAAADAVAGYKDTLDALNGVNISAARSQLDWRNAVDEAREAVEKGAKVTDDETDALLSLADQANETAKAIIDQTGSVEESNRSLRDARQRFIDLAVEMGHSRAKAKELADRWVQVPTKRQTRYTMNGVDKALTDLDILRNRILNIPSSVDVAVRVGTINRLGPNPDAPRRAMGGPVSASTGYWVGEHGPEWFQPRQDGHVFSTPQSKAMAAAAAGYGMAGAGAWGGGGGSSTTYGPTFSPTYQIYGPDPRAVAAESSALLRRQVFERTGIVV